MLPIAVLKKNKLGALLNGHPWIYSGAIEKAPKENKAGWVRIYSSPDAKDFFGYGFYNPASQIALRLVSRNQEDRPDQPSFWRAKLEKAVVRRRELGFLQNGQACRLLHAEADGFPGLCIDLYDQVAVVQSNSLAGDRVKTLILKDFIDILPLKGVVESSAAPVRKLEGILPQNGVLHGEVPERLIFNEGSLQFYLDLKLGQKTGFYLDQRDNRLRLAEISRGANVLNAFSFTGAFGLHAAASGAGSVLQMDSSQVALDLARENQGLNQPVLAKKQCLFSYETADVLKFLAAKPEPIYDLLILDPPKFVGKRSDLEAGLKRYTETFRLGFDLLRRRGSGRALVFSCSQAVGWQEFTRAVFLAGRKAGVELTIESHLQQAGDHPVRVDVPESFYLKGFQLFVKE